MEGIPQLGTSEGLIISDTEIGTEAIAPLLVVAASWVKVSGLVVMQVPATAITVIGAPGAGVRGVEIRENEISGIGRDQARSGGGITAIAGVNCQGHVLEDLLIESNVITDMGTALSIMAGIGMGEEGNAVANRAAHIEIRSNRLERQNTGMAGFAASGHIGGSASENLLRDLYIVNNEVIDSLDVGLFVATTQTVQGSPTSSNVVEGVLLQNNSFTTPWGMSAETPP